MDTRSVGRWAAAYARAWELRDSAAAAALFTPDAAYRSLIFNEPHTGSIAIRAYWQRATSTQRDVRVWMGAPLVDGQRAAIEWWTVMTDEGEERVTLPGCLLLEFDGERCARLNEYWHSEPGAAEPYEGWGRITDADTERTKDAAIRWTGDGRPVGRPWTRPPSSPPTPRRDPPLDAVARPRAGRCCRVSGALLPGRERRQLSIRGLGLVRGSSSHGFTLRTSTTWRRVETSRLQAATCCVSTTTGSASSSATTGTLPPVDYRTARDGLVDQLEE
jgi:hypothetical protein